MIVAVPVFGERVSPLFDTACNILLVDLEGNEERSRRRVVIDESFPPGKISRLVKLGVNILICGGISRGLLALVENSGIRVIPWVAGEIEEVLAAFKTGELPASSFMMPGCRRRLRRRSGRASLPGVYNFFSWDSFN